MIISNIACDLFQVFAVKSGQSDHDILMLFQNFRPDNSRDSEAISSAMARLKRLARKPASLPSSICHNLSRDIWQLRSDTYRILWFYDKGRVIVCTHFFVKKSRKTPAEEIKRANFLREEYFKAKTEGTLEIIE